MEGITDTAKSQCRKQLLEDANYDLAKKDSRNVFSQCQLEIVCCISINYIIYYIVPCDQDFVPIKFYFKYCINDLHFQATTKCNMS